MRPAQRATNGRQSMTVQRRRLAVITAGVAVLLASLLILPPAAVAGPSHQHGGISQLHRLAVEAGSGSVADVKGQQAAAVDGAILASLVLLAAALAALVRARQRLQPPAGRPVPALRSRGPPH
jgi:hypothetical protein